MLYIRYYNIEAGFYIENSIDSRLNSLRTIALREAATYALTSYKGAIILY